MRALVAITCLLASSVALAEPDALDRAMIARAVNSVKPGIRKCGDDFKATGTVKVAVRVGPDGKVTNVEIKATPDAKLGACVADTMRAARFPVTKTGGSFSYPFVFQ